MAGVLLYSLSIGLLIAAGPARAGDVVEQAARLIQHNMPRSVDARALEDAAIEGMVRWLDQEVGEGNAILKRADYEALQARLRGERIGLGIEFTVASGRGLLVAAVVDGSPAALAGIQPGDLVVGIDDTPFIGATAQGIFAVVSELADRAVQRPVRLDIRQESGELRPVSLVPASFRSPTVTVLEDEDRLVLRLHAIGPSTAAQLGAGLGRAAGRAVVLDLRDLSDGRLEDLPAVAGVFLGPGRPLLTVRPPQGEPRAVQSSGSAVGPDKVLVLVNRGTAGLAEGLALALRAHDHAVVVGTRTAGRASHPSFHPLEGDRVLRLADTLLLAADGASWGLQGVQPDLVVEPLQVPLVGASRAGLPDIQVEAGLRFLAAP